MKLVALTLALLLTASSAQAVILFKDGWDSPANNDVPNPKTKKNYTAKDATEYLSRSDEMRKLIQGPAPCVLEVTKGCHQKSKPHFTVNGTKSKSTCNVKSLYLGSNSDHEPDCDKDK